MAPSRNLPEYTNPLMTEDRSPVYEILVERRCLGSTELKVKTGQLGTSNATKPENLGTLDYAHLRVPLPKDLSASGIFQKGRDRKYPESYFLMRRSSDGYISATGMFKAAFPYAQVEEEAEEKAYIKSLDRTPEEEVAGNVWIHPEEALSLAHEYGIRHWIVALLDPEDIKHGTGEDKSRDVESPPVFRAKMETNGTRKSPEKKTPGKRSTRGAPRATRDESPTETKSATRPKATPGRGRGRPRKNKGADDTASVTSEAVNGDHQDTVKVEVEQVEDGDDEKTKVRVEIPSGHPDLPLPDDAAGMIEQARRMVKDAEKISGPSARGGAKGKRKAEDMIDETSEDGPAAASNKRHKMEVQLRKERIRRRAFTGLAATLAVGALIPSIMAAFPWS